MQEESALKNLAYTWAQAHVHKRPAHIFLVACTPGRMLHEDPPERAWIADLRSGGVRAAAVIPPRLVVCRRSAPAQTGR
jgi:hypothetical protein